MRLCREQLILRVCSERIQVSLSTLKLLEIRSRNSNIENESQLFSFYSTFHVIADIFNLPWTQLSNFYESGETNMRNIA